MMDTYLSTGVRVADKTLQSRLRVPNLLFCHSKTKWRRSFGKWLPERRAAPHSATHHRAKARRRRRWRNQPVGIAQASLAVYHFN